jgi:two-component system cell cycle sensor histidine kinase/response regulator CckA
MAPREGIWTIDAEGNTTFANAGMAAMLRTTIAEMVGKPSFQFVFPEDVEAARELFDAKGRGDMKPFEFRIRRADGTPLWVTVQGTPMRDEAGRFLGVIGTFRVMRRPASIKPRTRTADQ